MRDVDVPHPLAVVGVPGRPRTLVAQDGGQDNGAIRRNVSDDEQCRRQIGGEQRDQRDKRLHATHRGPDNDDVMAGRRPFLWLTMRPGLETMG